MILSGIPTNPASATAVSAPSELHAAYDEVLRKIGRNLLIFQQAEVLIKKLNRISSFSACSDDTVECIEKRTYFCEKKTLGQIVNLYVDRHLVGDSQSMETTPVSEPEPKSGERQFSVHITLGGTEGYPEARKQALAALVVERNELVHHFIQQFDRNSLESCLQASSRLDEQRQKILPEIHQLQEDLKRATEGLKQLISLCESSIGMELLFKPEIQLCPLVTNLAAIAAENPDPTAWTPLGPALKRLQDFPKEKISELVAQFGLKSLTQLLEASNEFDVQIEPTKNGKHRTMYRLKFLLHQTQ